MTKLTTQDLEDTIEDPRHLGYGYAEAQYLPTTTHIRLDRLVVAAANDLGWDAEELFAWSNSKYGRWLSDDFSGPRKDKIEARRVVALYVNAEAAAVLKAGG